MNKLVKIGLGVGAGVAAVAGIGFLIYKGVQKVKEEMTWATEEYEENAYAGCEPECDCCKCEGETCDCGCECDCHADPEVKEEPVAEIAPEAAPEVKEEVAEEKTEEKPAKAKKEKVAKAE